MSGRPRVLVVGPWPPTVGGVTSFMLKLVESALANEFEFRRFTTSRPPKKSTVDNWGYGAIFQGGVKRMIAGAAITLWHMLSFPVHAIRADIVQIQASDFLTFWESTYYVLVARALGRPVVLRLGGAFDRFYESSSARMQRWIRRAIRVPDRLIVQSEYWARYVSVLDRKDGIVAVPNWVPESAIDTPVRATGSVCCLFIAGTEARRKGLEPLLEAAARLPGLRFRIVAAPADLPPLPNLDPCGVLGRSELQTAMKAADIFVLPSFGEGFPNSLIEAMAVGLPAVATPVGAVPEIIRDGENGLLVPLGDGAALAAALDRLTQDPALRGRMGEAARRTVRDAYCEDKVLDRLRLLYRGLKTRS